MVVATVAATSGAGLGNPVSSKASSSERQDSQEPCKISQLIELLSQTGGDSTQRISAEGALYLFDISSPEEVVQLTTNCALTEKRVGEICKQLGEGQAVLAVARFYIWRPKGSEKIADGESAPTEEILRYAVWVINAEQGALRVRQIHDPHYEQHDYSRPRVLAAWYEPPHSKQLRLPFVEPTEVSKALGL